MSYTNAIYYLDYNNGTNGAGVGIAGVASNPSGTITRIASTGHGLDTGAVVDLTLFSSWLNSAWKITKVDNNNFDLDGAVWQATADPNGTVTPRRGHSWASAWKSMGSTTSSLTQAGDTVRIAKSSDPVSLGNATWTRGSNLVVLANSPTTLLSSCEGNWSGAGADCTVTQQPVATGAKEGSYSQKFTFDASPVTSTRQAYTAINLGTIRIAKISFWIYTSYTTNANNLRIATCSDSMGTSPTVYYDIPANIPAGKWSKMVINRTGGAADETINSLALYTGSSITGLASQNIVLDNISGTATTTGLDIRSVISKNSSATDDTGETWYSIKSMYGGTLRVDLDYSSKSNAVDGFYWGREANYPASEIVTTYYRDTIFTSFAPTSSTDVQTITVGGSSTANITYTGGWDTSTSTKNGMTIFDGGNGYGNGLSITSAISYLEVNNIGFIGYNNGVNIYPASTPLTNSLFIFPLCNNNSNHGIYLNNVNSCEFKIGTTSNNAQYGLYTSSSSVKNLIFTKYNNSNGNYAGGIGFFYSKNIKMNCVMSVFGNGTYGMYLDCTNLTINPTSFSCRYNGNYGIMLATNNCSILKNGTISDSSFGISIHGCSDTYLENFNITSSSYDIYSQVTSSILFLKNCTLNATNEYSLVRSIVYSQNHDGTANNDLINDGLYVINKQNTTRHTASGYAWTITPNTNIYSSYPVIIDLAEVYLPASSSTLKLWVKKGTSLNANVAGYLFIPNIVVGGVYTTATSSITTETTDWQELSLTVTPSTAGVVKLQLIFSSLSNNVMHLDDFTLPDLSVTLNGMEYTNYGKPWIFNVPATSTAVSTAYAYF